jgi:predicted anti-sigma-YlaC factor YlaD
MQKIIEFFTDIVMNPVKSLATTLTGAATGSLIDAKVIMLQANISIIETLLRNGAWLVSILVGICTIYSFVEKLHTKHKTRKKS